MALLFWDKGLIYLAANAYLLVMTVLPVNLHYKKDREKLLNSVIQKKHKGYIPSKLRMSSAYPVQNHSGFSILSLTNFIVKSNHIYDIK